MSWKEFKKKKEQEKTNYNTNPLNASSQMSSWQKFKQEKETRNSGSKLSSWEEFKNKENGTTNFYQDEEDTWFKGSKLFDDGYQFGDISGTVAGTVGDVGVNLVKGAGGLVEGVGDLISYGAADVVGVFGNENKANEIRANAQKNTIDELFKPVDDFLDEYSVLGEKSDSLVEGLGYVAAITAVSIVSGGVGGALGASTATSATIGTTATTFASAMGNGMSEALKDGATLDEARIYGAISGVAEASSELMFGGLGKASQAM